MLAMLIIYCFAIAAWRTEGQKCHSHLKRNTTITAPPAKTARAQFDINQRAVALYAKTEKSTPSALKSARFTL
jgi:hypothetical protein